jgi:hypothetical protein
MSDEVGLIESGLVLCGESGVLGELVEYVLVVARGGAQGAGLGPRSFTLIHCSMIVCAVDDFAR